MKFCAAIATVIVALTTVGLAKKVRPLEARWFVPSLVRPGVEQFAYFVIEGPRWIRHMKDFEFEENYKITVKRPLPLMPDFKLRYPTDRKRVLQLRRQLQRNGDNQTDISLQIDKHGRVDPGGCRVERINSFDFRRYSDNVWRAVATYAGNRPKRLNFFVYKVTFNLPRFFAWSLLFSPVAAIRLNIRERGHLMGGYFHHPASQSPFIVVVTRNSNFGRGRFIGDDHLKNSLHFPA